MHFGFILLLVWTDSKILPVYSKDIVKIILYRSATTNTFLTDRFGRLAFLPDAVLTSTNKINLADCNG